MVDRLSRLFTERRMSNYVTNYLQRSTSTLTQVDMRRRPFQYYLFRGMKRENIFYSYSNEYLHQHQAGINFKMLTKAIQVRHFHVISSNQIFLTK